MGLGACGGYGGHTPGRACGEGQGRHGGLGPCGGARGDRWVCAVVRVRGRHVGLGPRGAHRGTPRGAPALAPRPLPSPAGTPNRGDAPVLTALPAPHRPGPAARKRLARRRGSGPGGGGWAAPRRFAPPRRGRADSRGSRRSLPFDPRLPPDKALKSRRRPGGIGGPGVPGRAAPGAAGGRLTVRC